jgi:ClpP class serine protease
MDLLNLLWLFFIFSSLTPVIQQRMLEAQRMRLLRKIEKQRGSRAIALIHRQESIRLLGIPVARYIDIEDSEQVIRAIRMTPTDKPIDLILHTPGGLVLAAEQIARALIRHQAPVRVLVPHYAMSGGTMLALAADEIIMEPNAVLGPVDPQLGEWPAASIVKVAETKPISRIHDETLILADVGRKAIAQVRAQVRDILVANGTGADKAEELAETLSTGKWTHDYPIGVTEARGLGLRIRDELPDEVYDLMALYRDPNQRRPSVEFVPTPYGGRSTRPAPSPQEAGRGA